MWHARLSRREFTELCLGAQKSFDGRLERASGVVIDGGDMEVNCYWERETDAAQSLPNLVVVPDEDLGDILLGINASPQAPSPLTSMCRVLTKSEARQQFNLGSLDLTIDMLPATAALAMAEATLHSEGRIGLRQVSMSMCKRTLSYAWGRALARRAPPECLGQLPSRWVETYNLINPEVSHAALSRTVSATVGALSVATQLSSGARPGSNGGAMAHALLSKDRRAKDLAWRDLVRFPHTPPSLEQFATATREERGTFLQQALRESQSLKEGDPHYTEATSAACAFIATQVAPGSLEHFELLRATAKPDALLWYVLYATLQGSHSIMSAEQSLGLRLLRDVEQMEDQVARPTADIAFAELKALERVGIVGIARKLGHVGEVKVELVPYVTSSFTYGARSARGRDVTPQLPLDTDHDLSPRTELPVKARMNQLLGQLLALVNEVPDRQQEQQPPSSHRPRRK